MIQTVRLGGRLLGPGQPCYLIAEVGTTCLGDLKMAIDLVRAAADAGMDAVKFQMIDPEQLSDGAAEYRVVVDGQVEQVNMKDMFRRLSFTDVEWQSISDACRDCSIHFFATVDHLAGVSRLERIGVPAHKMGAWDVTYRPLVERIAQTGKPMFLDLGPASEHDVDELIAWFKAAGGEVVMCMHDFHTRDDTQMNLRAIPYLAQRYPWPAGFSSPNRDSDLDFAALALGAAHIEKRLILSRSLKAFHAHESLEPDELQDWVTRVRHVERALGRPGIIPSAVDLDQSAQHFRSVCTLRPVKRGEILSPDNLDGKRPGTGIPAAQLARFWGRRAAHDLPENHLIEERDIA